MKELMLEETKKEGTDLSEFYDIIEDLTDTTNLVPVNLDDMILLSYNPRTNQKIAQAIKAINCAYMNHRGDGKELLVSAVSDLYKQKKDADVESLMETKLLPIDKKIYQQWKNIVDEEKEKLYVQMLEPKKITDEWREPRDTFIKKQSIIDKGGTAEMIEEAEKDTRLLMMYDRNIYFVSHIFIRDLAEAVGLKGSLAMEHSYYKNAEFARKMGELKTPATLICRTNEYCKKVLSMGSKKYGYIPQTMIKRVIQFLETELGDIVCYHWTVTPEYTQIFMEFPKKAEELRRMYGLKDDFVPGIQIETSDARGSAFRIISSWRKGYSIMSMDEWSKQHRNNLLNIQELELAVRENIFDKFTVLPERLCDLLKINLTPMVKEPKELKRKNKEIINKTLRNCLRESGVAKVLGQKRIKTLMDCLLAEFDYSLMYTAYDIVVRLLEVPDRITGIEDRMLLDELKKACGRIPYCKFEEQVVKTPKITLMA